MQQAATLRVVGMSAGELVEKLALAGIELRCDGDGTEYAGWDIYHGQAADTVFTVYEDSFEECPF